MGFARLLLKEKLALFFYVIFIAGGFMLTACNNSLVKYDDFLEKPSATRKGDVIEINLGFTAASSNWIKPIYKINNGTIYVSGELTFKEIPQKFSIKLPSGNDKYKVMWIDGDDKKTEISVTVR